MYSRGVVCKGMQSRLGDEVEITNCVIKGIQAITLLFSRGLGARKLKGRENLRE